MAIVNSANATKVEISLFYNTLAGLVKNLENQYTNLDLRNDCCVTGKIVKVDAYMNIEMEDVIFYDMRGDQKPLMSLYVSSRNIRYVHIPKSKNALKLLRAQLEIMTKKKTKSGRVFKIVRAEKKNMETIREAYLLRRD